jgi:hypothetical protein
MTIRKERKKAMSNRGSVIMLAWYAVILTLGLKFRAERRATCEKRNAQSGQAGLALFFNQRVKSLPPPLASTRAVSETGTVG